MWINHGEKLKALLIFFPNTKSCSISGVIYILDYSTKSIVVFDLRAENFRIIGLGNEIRDNILNYGLIEVKGKVALLDRCECFSGRNDL